MEGVLTVDGGLETVPLLLGRLGGLDEVALLVGQVQHDIVGAAVGRYELEDELPLTLVSLDIVKAIGPPLEGGLVIHAFYLDLSEREGTSHRRYS